MREQQEQTRRHTLLLPFTYSDFQFTIDHCLKAGNLFFIIMWCGENI
jgi:hypothetical protein